jgi:SET domain-containing protein
MLSQRCEYAGMPRRRTYEEQIEVRPSRVHGRGVFATARIPKGGRVIEYTGARLPWKIAQDLPPHDPAQPYHTFYFSLENGDVIDAADGGNKARWINHSCAPNCESEEKESRIWIYALRTIEAGEELFYDYRIVPAEPRSKELEKHFACFCGATTCRGSMLEPLKKRRRKRARARGRRAQVAEA